MSKRPIRGESSTAHKRQAVTQQDEENTLPSASASESASSSLARQASSLLSIPKIPLHLIADLILPFVADRETWNSVCSASKETCLAAKKMTPPWPNKAFNLGNVSSRHVSFTPSGSQLAFCAFNGNTGQDVVHVWDRWGKETLLGGYTSVMSCLEYSLDGEYLASGSRDGSVRIWSRESFHTASSKPCMEIPTRTPKQADKILVGRHSGITALSFSRTDSNLLASGGSDGEIKVWNVKEQACIHSFESHGAPIRSLFFAGGADIACIAIAGTGSIIRLWKAEGTSDLASETIGKADRGGTEICCAVFSPSGSSLATCSDSRRGNGSTVALYELEIMTKTQSVIMPGFFPSHIAVSLDSKQLVIGDHQGRIRLLKIDVLSIQRDLDPSKEVPNMPPVLSVAFDPTCRVLAFGYHNGGLELRNL